MASACAGGCGEINARREGVSHIDNVQTTQGSGVEGKGAYRIVRRRVLVRLVTIFATVHQLHRA